MKKSRLPNLIILSLLLYLGYFTYNNFDDIISGFNKIFSNTVDIINKSDLVSIYGEGSLVNDVADLEDSGIKGNEQTFDTEYYPYYGLLTEKEKSVYKQVYANAIALETTFLPDEAVHVEEASRAIEAVYNDHPELFWVDTSYSYKYNSENKCVQIILSFNKTKENIDEARTNFFSVANSIIEKAKNFSTDYEKEKFVHDTLAAMISYDVNSPLNQSAYSALVNGSTVCAGYARAFQYIMTCLEIPTYYVFGYSDGEHAWNIVKLDGEFYNVDLTWDDGDNLSYAFFNQTDNVFAETHTRKKESVLLPDCTATKYSNLNDNIITYESPDYEDYQNENDNTFWWQDEEAEIP